MAWSQVQEQDNNAASSSSVAVTATFDSTPTDDNLLIAVFSYHDNSNDPETPPTGWSKAKMQNSFTTSIGIWYKIASSDSTAVPFAWTGGARSNLYITEYSGNATSSVLNVTAGADGGSSSDMTLSSGTTATTGENNQLWIAGWGMAGTSGGFSAFSNSFTEIFDGEGGGSGGSTNPLGIAHRLEADIAAATSVADWANNRRVGSVIATFNPSGGAPPIVPERTKMGIGL